MKEGCWQGKELDFHQADVLGPPPKYCAGDTVLTERHWLGKEGFYWVNKPKGSCLLEKQTPLGALRPSSHLPGIPGFKQATCFGVSGSRLTAHAEG